MATAKEEAKTKTVASDGMELVKAFYPDIPGTHYSGDIQVGINGKMYLVKRGEDVEIPRCVKEVIDWSMSEDQKTEKKLKELESR